MSKPGDIGPAERQSLKNGPRDMPDRGSRAPNAQTASERVSLSRTPHRVANLENRPGMGTVQSVGEKVKLSRSENMPYGEASATVPRTPFGKGKR